jgi:hypothetical protein
MSDLRTFRQYDEHDVINLFTWSGTTSTSGVLMQAGLLVKINTGFSAGNEPVDLMGDAGNAYNNTLSETWKLTANVAATGEADTPLGMALVAVRDLDENGEKLLYNPRKAAEMGVVVPGQSVPILTRGLIMVKSDHATWTPAAGGTVYAGLAGELTSSNANSVVAVGIALGTKDSNGYALVKLEL